MAKRDKTKDFFYNAIDYLVMLVIIIGVIIILGWKFEILLNKSTQEDTAAIQNNTEKDVKPTEKDTETKDIKEVNEIDKKDGENTDKPTEIDVNTNDSENNNTENSSNADENATNETNGESNNTDTNTSKNNDNQTTTDEKPTEQNNTTETKPKEDAKPSDNNSGSEVTVNIPAGTLPGATGQILASNGIVESSDAFVKKAVELGLDRKLKSGEFKLKKGMSLDQVVRAIAKQ